MKYITIFSLIIAIAIMLLGSSFYSGENIANTSEFLRIHIRANSNDIGDQTIKYEIKNEIVEALIPILSNCNSKELAFNAIESNFKLIENVSNNILKKDGLNYSSKAKLTKEYFPTRSYNDIVLESGTYDALIVELGEAKGDNWWCVVYPPLCFVNSSAQTYSQVVYKSKLLEIIRKFFKG